MVAAEKFRQLVAAWCCERGLVHADQVDRLRRAPAYVAAERQHADGASELVVRRLLDLALQQAQQGGPRHGGRCSRT